MAEPQELPQLAGEFVDMAKAYVRQETLDPVKHIGRYFAFILLASLAAAVAVVPLAIAGTRALIWVMPEPDTHRIWTGLGFMLSSLGVVGLAGLVVWGASR